MKKYPKVRAVGHREIADLFTGPVVIQEKIDGSNFGFGWVDKQLVAVSRRLDLSFTRPEKLFEPALDYVSRIAARIPGGCFFRCEFLSRPKHNVLAYTRVPLNNLVLFDVEAWDPLSGVWVQDNSRQMLEAAARQLDIEPVREICRGVIYPADARAWFIEKWSKQESQLGGPAMEGVVIKNYDRFTPDGSVLLGKWVREEFKEIHRHKSAADKTDPIEVIGTRFGGPARWQKAVQRLIESGECTNSPEDIGKLISFVRGDVEEECVDEIKEVLWKHYRRNIAGCSTKGLAEWYKEKLGL